MFIDIFVCSAKEQLKVGYGAIKVYIIILFIIQSQFEENQLGGI